MLLLHKTKYSSQRPVALCEWQLSHLAHFQKRLSITEYNQWKAAYILSSINILKKEWGENSLQSIELEDCADHQKGKVPMIFSKASDLTQ